ncbi:hypothetical protein ACG7TL_006939 [Trametes sanguinea]
MSDGDHSTSSDSSAGRPRAATGRPNGASNGRTNGTNTGAHAGVEAGTASQPPVVPAGTYTNGGTSRTNGGGLSDSSSSSGRSHPRTHTLPPAQAAHPPPEPRRVATKDLYYNLHGLPRGGGAPPAGGYGSQFGSPQGSPQGFGSPQGVGSPYGGSPTRAHGSPQSSASGGAMPPPGSPLSSQPRTPMSSASGMSAMPLSQYGSASPHPSLDSARASSGVQGRSPGVPSSGWGIDQAALDRQAATQTHARTGSLPV